MNRESQEQPKNQGKLKAKDIIPKEIQDQILQVRDTGEVNMFDVNGVQRVANDNGLYELVSYLIDKVNQKVYWNFILGK